jgi:sulfide:quinone oxidoreductase
MASDLAHVVVAGGGPAAVETVLGLREQLGDGVSLELVAPDRDLVIRAYEVMAPFQRGGDQRYPLTRIAADLGAQLTRGAVAAVNPGAHTVLLRSGQSLRYDVLVMAVGGVHAAAVDGAVLFRGGGDATRVKALLLDARSGIARNVAFVLPGGHGWPLPLYELALQSAGWLQERGLDHTPLVLVSPESSPLEVFGELVSTGVGALLVARQIEFVSGFPISHARGSLGLAGGRRVPADIAIALPRMRGPHMLGLPSDPEGFLPVDEQGRVVGVHDVWAAGDAISFPVKQGGLATQQGGAAASSIAAALGASVEVEQFRPVLRAVLVGSEQPWFLRAELERGRPLTSEISATPMWSEPGKLVGRRLAPYLARSPQSVETTEPVR